MAGQDSAWISANPPLAVEIASFVDKLIARESELMTAPFPALDELRSEVRALGLWNPHRGKGLREFAPLSEEMGRSPFGHYVFNCQAPDVGNMEVLDTHATPAQRAAFLEPLLAGEVRSCFAMTEPEFAGSNPVHLGTTATRDGDFYVLNGHKWFTSSADGAAFAIVMAVTCPDAPAHERASQIIVPTDTPGWERVRNIPVMGEEGAGYFSHAEVFLRECRVPVTNLLGAEGKGFAIAQQRLGPGRIHHCMRWIGICRRALDLMLHRAASRELAPGRFLGQQQTVQAWIADSHAEIAAARLLVLDAAARLDEGDTSRTVVSTIKYFVADVLQKVLDRAIQVHGAAGLTDQTPLAYWYRHERGARIYDGPDEVHRMVVARELLKPHG